MIILTLKSVVCEIKNKFVYSKVMFIFVLIIGATMCKESNLFDNIASTSGNEILERFWVAPSLEDFLLCAGINILL